MKRIIIMGATSGIGRAVAERLARAGWLVGAAGRNAEALEQLQSKYPANIVTARIDITQKGADGDLRTLIHRLGGMDIYFHVSGIWRRNPGLKIDEEVSTVDTNVIGFARMTAAAYRYFRDSKRPGQIAAVTSVAGTNGIGRMASYSSSKAFQQTYLRALNQLATIDKADVCFTDIRPGWVKTPLLDPEGTYPMEMTVDYVVPRILLAILTKRRVAVIDWRWNLIVGLWRMMPNSLWVRTPYKI